MKKKKTLSSPSTLFLSCLLLLIGNSAYSQWNGNSSLAWRSGAVVIGSSTITGSFGTDPKLLQIKGPETWFTMHSTGGAGSNFYLGVIPNLGYTGMYSTNLPLVFFVPSERMRITTDGKVGIGTSIPDSKLTVKGLIHAEEVKVDLNVPGPDYVFEPEYHLPSIDELTEFIYQNKHLPDVPSADDMSLNGVNVGEMNMILLRKIEELTLYVIALEKQSRMQQDRIFVLESNAK